MVSSLSTTGSIASHIATIFVLPAGVSGNLVDTVDLARIDVQNFVGNNISPDGIDDTYQSAIVNISKAQALQETYSWAATLNTSGVALISSNGTFNGEALKLAELSVGGVSQDVNALRAMSVLSKDAPKFFNDLAMGNLNSIGRGARFARSLS